MPLSFSLRRAIPVVCSLLLVFNLSCFGGDKNTAPGTGEKYAKSWEAIDSLSNHGLTRLGYYESTRDAATNFFFGSLRKGTYVFEYPLVVTHAGDFSNGITTIQCMYAPELTSQSEGVRVKVGKGK